MASATFTFSYNVGIITVTGTVMNSFGNSVPGARVFLQMQSGPTTYLDADDTGYFTFGVPEGLEFTMMIPDANMYDKKFVAERPADNLDPVDYRNLPRETTNRFTGPTILYKP